MMKLMTPPPQDSQAHPLFKQLLNAAGVKANELDESTAQFITDYVDQMGGIETLEKKPSAGGTTKPSGRPPPPAPPSRGGGAAPPPPPSLACGSTSILGVRLHLHLHPWRVAI